MQLAIIIAVSLAIGMSIFITDIVEFFTNNL
jgi:ABC-type phosphate transport system permease subunit